MEDHEFIGKTIYEMMESGIKVNLRPKNQTYRFKGWFDGTNKIFFCHMGGEDGFQTYVHEYCHFLQWRDDYSFWDKNSVYEDFWWWIRGLRRKTKKQVQSDLRKSIRVEHDCEMRVLATIKKYKLNINREVYAQRANLYVLYYKWMVENRKIYTQNLYIEELVKKMPKKMLNITQILNDKTYGKILKEFLI